MRIFSLFAVILLSSCGGSSGIDSTTEYDLSQYFFHDNLLVQGGEIRFVENHYEKPSGDGPVYAPTTIQVSTDNGIEQSGLGGTVFYRFLITDDSIVEEGVSFSGSRTYNRFASVGQAYVTGGSDGLSFLETCTFQEHLASFDLSTATGSVVLATGVYDDVIQVYCDSVFEAADG